MDKLASLDSGVMFRRIIVDRLVFIAWLWITLVIYDWSYWRFR